MRSYVQSLLRADVSGLRAALWAVRAARRAPSSITRAGVEAPSIPPPPRVGASGERAVLTVLRCRHYTCLERALVRQAWDAAQGVRRELIIGVTSPSRGFSAHAWLEGDAPSDHEGFVELARWAAPDAG
jgi:hypothetical protein